MMPWLPPSPGHQQPRYWLHTIRRPLPFMSKDFNSLNREEILTNISSMVAPENDKFRCNQWLKCGQNGHGNNVRRPYCLLTFCSGADQRKHQSTASLTFVRGIHWWPVVPLTKGQWRGKCFHLMTSSWKRFYMFCWVIYKLHMCTSIYSETLFLTANLPNTGCSL